MKSSALIISLTEPKDQLELTVNNQMLRFCLDIMDATKSKEEMNHQLLISTQMKPSIRDGMEGHECTYQGQPGPP